MVIDTSAVVAIPLGEAGAERFVRALNEAAFLSISAASVLEIDIVIDSRLGHSGVPALDRWLERSPIEVVAVTRRHIEVAREGYRRFGEGRHPAGLNFGDCFAYALAKVSGDSLRFQGNDFSKTDIVSAI